MDMTHVGYTHSGLRAILPVQVNLVYPVSLFTLPSHHFTMSFSGRRLDGGEGREVEEKYIPQEVFEF